MELITNILAIAAIVFVVGGAVLYMVLAKKRGEKCIGCPYAKQCGGNCNGGCTGMNDITNKKD